MRNSQIEIYFRNWHRTNWSCLDTCVDWITVERSSHWFTITINHNATLVTGIMDGKHKVGRPHREWTNDVVGWCKASLQVLNYCAHDRTKWKQTVTPWRRRQTPTRVERKVNDNDDGWMDDWYSSVAPSDWEIVALSSFEENAADAAKSRNACERCCQFYFARAVVSSQWCTSSYISWSDSLCHSVNDQMLRVQVEDTQCWTND